MLGKNNDISGFIRYIRAENGNFFTGKMDDNKIPINKEEQNNLEINS